MQSNTATDGNTDRPNFFLTNPYPRIAVLAVRWDSKVETDPAHDLFKLRNKTPHSIFMQQGRKDRIRNKLTRRMIGRPPTPVGILYAQTFFAELRG